MGSDNDCKIGGSKIDQTVSERKSPLLPRQGGIDMGDICKALLPDDSEHVPLQVNQSIQSPSLQLSPFAKQAQNTYERL